MKDKINDYFKNKEYDSVINLIESIDNIDNEIDLLQNLGAAYFYKRDYRKAKNVINRIEKHDEKLSYEMAIDLELGLGKNCQELLKYMDMRSHCQKNAYDESWLNYKYGEYYLATGHAETAVQFMDKVNVNEFYDFMKYEYHFWRNYATGNVGSFRNEYEKANNLLISAKKNNDKDLAKMAELKANELSYGDLEIYAKEYRMKYHNKKYDELEVFRDTITWKML